MIDHDFCLEANGMVMILNVLPQFLPGAARVEFGVVFYGFDEAVVTVDGRVVSEHIHNEALLNGLLHGVTVER